MPREETRVRERAIDWLAGKASDYLVWVHEREVRGAPTCLDCELPEPHCCCDERYREDKMLEAAYEDGGRAAIESLRSEGFDL